jgi:bifunctional polynucleotide phosphatase/kinase
MSSIIYINYYTNLVPGNNYSVSGFDLDYTIIKTKSRNIFPKDKNDWELWDQSVKNKFFELSKIPNKLIIIFSNQKGIGRDTKKFLSVKDFQDKIHNIRKELGVNFIFIAALEDDIYRKPRPGMWNYIEEKLFIKINKKSSFYVGDMAGRPNDKYDTDLKFALNLKIKFLTPEEYFLEDDTKFKSTLTGYQLDNFSTNTKLNINPESQTMIIISGYPGSGKSHLAKKFIKTTNTDVSNKFELFSRDDLGTKFMKKLIESMENKKPVVIEGLYWNNESRKELKNLSDKYKYNSTYILVKTSYELAYHLNLYRSLYESKNKVPEIVYMKYRKNFEYPDESDWDKIIEYHPHIPKKVNKYYLY